MRKTTLALISAAALGAAAAAVLVPLAANADKTVVYLTAQGEVTQLNFFLRPGGAVDAVVCGRTKDSLGNLTQPTCYPTSLAAGNAIATSVNSLATGNALVFWKTQEGL